MTNSEVTYTFETVKLRLKKERFKKPLKGNMSPGIMQLISDTIAFVISFAFQFYLRFESGIIATTIRPDIAEFTLGAGLFSLYWYLVYYFSGLYKNWYIKSPFEEFFTVLKVSFFGYAIFVFLILFSSYSSRMMFIYNFFIFITLVSAGRLINRRIQKKLRALGFIASNSVILGTSAAINKLYKNIKLSPSWGIKPVGSLVVSDEEAIEWNSEANAIKTELPLFGTINTLSKVIEEIKPNELIISGNLHDAKFLLNTVNLCTEKNVRVKIEPDLYHIFTGQTRTHNIYGIPLIEISPQLLKPWQEIIKRAFDIVFSFLVIALGMPLWLLVALIIKLESKGNVFYKQPRVGKNEKVFQIYKFRSMVQDADRGKQTWTKVGDPRVTRFGKFIRKSHLDEIPQFWNVLKGEMSIVGPRPEQPHFVNEFTAEIPYYKRRLKVRPGITGWWQVKYQAHELNVEEIENRLKDDFYYIENMSLKLDIEIVIRTVWCVIKGHGQT